MNERNFKDLQDSIGYFYKNPDLLRQALMHSSYVNEKGLGRDAGNERLEFLGDSVLGMTIAGLLYEYRPTLTEGEMTKLRAKLVCEESLNKKAQKLELGSYLQLGKGEDITGGRSRPSILADAFEAVIASIYLDGGFEPVKIFISDNFAPEIKKPDTTRNDHKTILQEYVQNKHSTGLRYILASQEGPDHDKTFNVQVLVNGKIVGEGTGKTKKSAEQAAAKSAIELLMKNEQEENNAVRLL